MEKILNEKIPIDIIQVLSQCGYETEISISSITPDTIKEIEEYVNEDLSVLKNTSYENVFHFKLKPGHKSFILSLPNLIHRSKGANLDGIEKCKTSDFSHILQTFIKSAECCFDTPPNGVRYDDTCRYFSTYVYLMCGRACYETLNANLPIPHANTICKSLL